MDIFVGNIAFAATEDDVRNVFAAYGTVDSVKIITEKHKQKSRGFGFVVMSDEQQALAAIESLNGKDLLGRPMNVSQAQSKPSAPRVTEAAVLPRPEAAGEEFFPEEDADGPSGDIPPVEKPGGYKRGRRSRKYQMRRAALEKKKPFVKMSGPHDAAKSWQKKDQSGAQSWNTFAQTNKPWKKSTESSKPWQKNGQGSKPWKKTGDGPKPWQNSQETKKPWQKHDVGQNQWHKKDDRGSKPWQKSGQGSKPWKKTGDGPKPWQKSQEAKKPWQKDQESSKPWQKKDGAAQPWRKRKGSIKAKGATQESVPWWQQKDRSQQYRALKKKKFR